MDIERFIAIRPYLYHLTDPRNVPLIIQDKRLISTKSLAIDSELDDKKTVEFLRNKRSGHQTLQRHGVEVYIRDQDPISMKSLAKGTTGGLTANDFLEILNERVFFWPTIKDLKIHFERYENEEPTILRFRTEDILTLNPSPEFCYLNSGAPRCIAHYGGKPAPRNRETFRVATQFERSHTSVREFTVVDQASLPSDIWQANHPDGPWEMVK